MGRFEFEIGPGKADGFGDPHPGLDEHLEQSLPLRGDGAEELDKLLARQHPRLVLVPAVRSDYADDAGGVRGNDAVLDGGGEQGADWREVLAHARRRLAE